MVQTRCHPELVEGSVRKVAVDLRATVQSVAAVIHRRKQWGIEYPLPVAFGYPGDK
jgi:hypothetical protein